MSTLPPLVLPIHCAICGEHFDWRVSSARWSQWPPAAPVCRRCCDVLQRRCCGLDASELTCLDAREIRQESPTGPDVGSEIPTLPTPPTALSEDPPRVPWTWVMVVILALGLPLYLIAAAILALQQGAR